MSKELHMGNSSQYITQNENLRAEDTVIPNVTVILPVYNEEVSVGSVVLQAKGLADKIIVLGNEIKSYRYNNEQRLEVITYLLTSCTCMVHLRIQLGLTHLKYRIKHIQLCDCFSVLDS